MLNIFDYIDYKVFVTDLVKGLPKKGRGTYTRLAEVAQTHKATISQIFRGDLHLTGEQALRICAFFDLSIRDSRFFVLLVNYASAGSNALQKMYLDQIEAERRANLELSNRLKTTHKLTGERRAIFYSSWIYSAVRVLSSIEHFGSLKSISTRLGLSISVVEAAAEILVESGLCTFHAGVLRPEAKSTYLESKSPLISRHHGNWRVKAMERHPMLESDELSYTSPVSLSSEDVKKIREILAKAIEKIDGLIEPSNPERMFCLNLDWFEVK